jgi:hypothetical protein
MRFKQEELDDVCVILEEKGYKKYRGHYKNEDFSFWKSFETTFDEDGDKKGGYQIALLFYDYSKYLNSEETNFGVQFEFVLNNNELIDRMDLSVSDSNMDFDGFENLSSEFYKSIYLNYIAKNF